MGLMKPSIIKNVLTSDDKAQLKERMQMLVRGGGLYADSLCPSSPSVYKDRVFQGLLDKLKPIAESYTGKKLLPTYTYARSYTTGEELIPHKDRPSCEISFTVQIFSDGDAWPIWTCLDEEEPVEHVLEDGDAVIYLGCDYTHWREPYKGKEQIQAFVHYVDADGPYAEYAGDAIKE